MLGYDRVPQVCKKQLKDLKIQHKKSAYAALWYSSDVDTVSPGIEAGMLYNRWAEMPSTYF